MNSEQPERPDREPAASNQLPFDPKRPRYYLLDNDPTFGPRMEFINEDDYLPVDRRGSHWVQIRGTDLRYSVGLPALLGKPKIRLYTFGSAEKPRDLYGDLVMSQRFKELIVEADPNAIELVECDTIDLTGKQLAPMWWLAVTRVLDCVDEERSVFTTQDKNPFSDGSPADRMRYLDLFDLVMREDQLEGGHIFMLEAARGRVIVGQVIADEARRIGLTGIRLTPLQPPTPEERRDHLRFTTFPYWTDRGYAPASTAGRPRK